MSRQSRGRAIAQGVCAPILGFLALFLSAGGAQAALGLRSAGGMLMDTAMSDSGYCLTCDVVGFFTVPLANFSLAIYTYFATAFFFIVPVLIMIWIGWTVAGLMVSGGEDGRRFLSGLAAKLALFFMVALAFSVTTSTPVGGPAAPATASSQVGYVWNTTGPKFLEFGFGVSNEIRNFATGGAGRFGCDGNDAIVLQTTATGSEFVKEAVRIACTIERVHLIGIASGITMMGATSETREWSGLWGTMKNVGGMIAGTIIRLFAGGLILFTFAISAVWLIFLVLDVVVRAMVTAAFMPLIGAMFLFKPSRQFATKAIIGLVASFGTILGLTIVSVLGFYLITNVVTIYNAVAAGGEVLHERLGIDGLKIEAITGGSLSDQYREFVNRISAPPKDPVVPMDLHMPWFLYMVASGAALLSLGKKIIAMIEGVTGQQGMSALADKATSTLKSATAFAGGTAAIGAAITAPFAKAGAGVAASGVKSASSMMAAGAAAGGGAAASGAKKMLNPFQDAFKNLTDGGGGSPNTISRGAQGMSQIYDSLGDEGASDPQ